MANLQTPLTTLVQFIEPKTGLLTDAGRTIIQQLIDRTGGPTGGAIVFSSGEVWGDPVGALSRAAFTTNSPLPVGAVYSQAELTDIRDQLLFVCERVGAIMADLKTSGLTS